MAAPSVGFDGMDINDGTIYSILPDADLGALNPTFAEYRSYTGDVAITNVSTAQLVGMRIPMKISGSSVSNLGANIAALNAIINAATVASPKALIFDGVTYSVVTSPEIDPPLTQSYQNRYFVIVDMVLNRLPTVTGTPGGGGGGGWTPGALSDDPNNVKYYGAVGNGVTDDTEAIQAAIDACAAAGGGTVHFPEGTYKVTDSIVPKAKVLLVGSGYSSSIESGYEPPVRIVGDGAFAVIDAGATTPNDFGMDGFGLVGSSTDTGSMGIYAEAANNWSLRNIFCDTFANQGIYIRGGVGGVYENIWVQNAFLKHADASTYVGAFQFGDASHYVSDIYAKYIVSTCSIADALGNYDHSGYLCGILVGASTSVLDGCIGHMSETGIKTLASASDHTHFMACRADLNQGHGFDVAGGNQTYIGCLALRNSRDTDATYSGFRVHNGNNTFIGCRIDGYSTEVQQLYGFVDDSDAGAPGNVYIGNRAGSLISGGLFNVTSYGEEPFILDFSGRKMQLQNAASHDGIGLGTGIVVGTGGPSILSGAVDPTAGGGVAAVQGSIFMRTDGGASTSIYIKTGSGDTAWTAK